MVCGRWELTPDLDLTPVGHMVLGGHMNLGGPQVLRSQILHMQDILQVDLT